MARADLATVDFGDLTALHKPLQSRRERSVEAVEEPAETAPERPATEPAKPAVAQIHVVPTFASLQAPPKEYMIGKSYRLPESMVKELDQFCTERKIEASAFVRDCISAGLRQFRQEPTRRGK